MAATAAAERQAIHADAEERLPGLLARRRALESDADDPHVLSELVWIDSEIRSAEAALAGAEGGRRRVGS